MLNIAIVEDEKEAAELLEKALKKYAKEKGETVNCVFFSYGEAFLNNYKPVYDVVFMDIILSGITGMETAHKLREHDEDVPLVFITSMAQFAIEGYSVNAVDYIVKPFNYYDLKMRMNRICRELRKKEEYITISSYGGDKYINIKDIFYIESRGHLLSYFTAEGVFSSYCNTMKELEQTLSAHNFARCSVSCLVNMAHITAVYGNEITIDNKVLRITRGKRKEFLDALSLCKSGKELQTK